MISENHAAWLESRGLDVELAAKYGLASKGNYLAFPYTRKGTVVSCKLRDTKEKRFKFDREGAQRVLSNLACLEDASSNPEEPLIIVEGELDALAILQCGYRYVVSVLTGASGKRTTEALRASEDTGFVFLWHNGDLIPELKPFRRIVLATDGDERGQILRDELALRLGEVRCDWVDWPEGVKDANDLLRHHGIDSVRALIENSKPMRPSHSVSLMDLPKRPLQITYSTGLPFLDPHIRLVPPELVVATGIPGHGKSQFTRSLGFHLAESHGWKGTFIATEDKPEHIRRDALRFAGRPGNAITPGVDKTSDTTVHRIRQQWVRNHLRIVRTDDPDSDHEMTVPWIIDEMEHAAIRFDCKWFIIDPWSDIAHDMGRQTETDYIRATLMKLKRHARRLRLVLIIVAHPRIMRDDARPGLYDISGSNQWRAKADHGLIIYRPDDASNLVSLTVAKCKDQETVGKPGEAAMQFTRDHCEFRFVPSRVEEDAPASTPRKRLPQLR
jgi:twinkle protein